MALKLAAWAVLVVLAVLSLTSSGQPAAAANCGDCSRRCVEDCNKEAPQKCESICYSIPELCDTCEAGDWKKCATECYARRCITATGPGSPAGCPPLATACSACDETCASPCNDVDQFLCAGDCLPLIGSAISPECTDCKDSAAKNCAAACRANLCAFILSCPAV